MKWLMAVWHWLRPRLVRLLTEECLERYLYRIGFYKIKSRILVDRCVFPGGIDLWVCAPDKGIVSGVLVARCYERAQIRHNSKSMSLCGVPSIFPVMLHWTVIIANREISSFKASTGELARC